MPLNRQAGLFTRLFRWTTRLQPGQAWLRADADEHADDIAAAITETYAAARRKTIALADLPAVGFPFEELVTHDPDGNRSLREWRLGQWVRTRYMQPNGAVVVIENPAGELVDSTPPPIPTGWSATPFSTGVIIAGASSPAEDFAAFVLYEGASGAAFGACVEVGRSASRSFVRPGMTIGVTRSFYVTAVDFSNNESAPTARLDAAPSGVLEDGVQVPSARLTGTTAARNSSSTTSVLQAKAMADHVTAGDHAAATTIANGFMAAADKVKLNGIAIGAQVNPPTTAGRNNSSTVTVLQAKAMADHVASGDHDSRYDARYPRLGQNNVFTGVNRFPSGGSQTAPTLRLGVDAGVYSSADGSAVFFAVSNVQAARIDPAGTSAAAATTTITREKGDARYALAAQAATGVGQSWSRPSRSAGTSYQNTTGRPIMVVISARLTGDGANVEVSTNGSTWVRVGVTTNSAAGSSVSIIVPAGHYYRLQSGASIFEWAELR